MKRFWKLSGLVTVLSVAIAIPAAAQPPSAALTLPVTGTFAKGGEFTGTISINTFALDIDGEIVAMGFVSGVLKRGNRTIATVVAEFESDVLVTAAGIGLASDRPRTSAKPLRIRWSPGVSSASTMIRVQETCPVLNLALGATTVDLLGLQVALSPVMLDIGGSSSAPLGALVCEASTLLINVVGLVGVLNDILGLLTGLLGGLTGGLGGVVPVP